MQRTVIVVQRRKVRFLRILVDLILSLATGGLWTIWLFLRYLRANS